MAGDADGCMSACPKHTHTDRNIRTPVYFHTHAGPSWVHICTQLTCMAVVWFLIIYFLPCDKNCRCNGMHRPTDNLDPICESLCFMNILIQIQLSIQAPGQAADNNTVSLRVMLSLCSPRPQTGMYSQWNHYESCLLWLTGIEQDNKQHFRIRNSFHHHLRDENESQNPDILLWTWIIRKLHSTSM